MNSNPSDLIGYCLWAKNNSGIKSLLENEQ